MARQAVTGRQLVKVDGMDEALKNIAKVMSKTTGEALKGAYIEAAKVLWKQARANIRALPLSDKAKAVLTAEVSIMRAPANRPYAMVGMSQQAGIRKLGKGGRFISNPYWFEFGTKRGMKPTPFFRPAVSMARPGIKEALAGGLKKVLDGAIKP